MRRALVLLSGGIDSAVALALMQRDGFEIVPLTFDYHARPRAERAAMDALVAAARRRAPIFPLQTVAVPFLREVEDMASRPDTLDGAPQGYIPARNLVFYGIAASVAEEQKACLIVGGHNGIDPERFPDSSPRFFDALNALLPQAVWSHARQPFRIIAPIAGKSKAEVVALGRALGVPFDLTWSCYNDGKLHCGACGSCLERRRAFAELGVPDPVAYVAEPTLAPMPAEAAP